MKGIVLAGGSGTRLFEQKKIITVTEKFPLGAPKMIRLNIEK